MALCLTGRSVAGGQDDGFSKHSSRPPFIRPGLPASVLADEAACVQHRSQCPAVDGVSLAFAQGGEQVLKRQTAPLIGQDGTH